MLEWENKIYLFVKKHRHLIRQWRELLGKKFFWVADLFFPAGIQYALSKTTRISSTQQQLNEYQCYRLEMYNFVNKSILSTKLLNIVQNYTCLLMLKYQKSLIFSLDHDQSGSWNNYPVKGNYICYVAGSLVISLQRKLPVDFIYPFSTMSLPYTKFIL